jgi:hypothetical protein
MNNFYEVDNVGKDAKSWWIIAKDKTDAMRIASTKPGKPTKCRQMKPYENISDLCKSGKTGILEKNIIGMSLADLLSGHNSPAQPKDPWHFMEEI